MFMVSLYFKNKKINIYYALKNIIVDVQQWADIMMFMIIEEIRKQIKQIKKSGISLNQIERDTGVDKAALSRIMNGGDCKTVTADILFKYFGIELIQKKKTKKDR